MAEKLNETAILEVCWRAGGADFLLRSLPDAGGENLTASSLFEWSAVSSSVREVHETISRSNRGGDTVGPSRRLEMTGRELFNHIVPPPIRCALSGLQARFLLLRLDADCASIPWELLHDGGDFLACNFAVGVIVADWAESRKIRRDRPSDSFSLLVLSDPCGDLPAAKAEGESLYRFLNSHPKLAVEWLNGTVSLKTVLAWLPRFLGVHHSGHGDTVREGRSFGSWRFDDGTLDGAGIHQVAQSSPEGIPLLVFSNACGAAGLPQIRYSPGCDLPSNENGFPQVEAFMGAGCEHFIGPFGDVMDEGGREFALRFYEQVLNGSPIGRGIQEARLHLRARQSQHGLTWAQYRLYGDPTVGLFGERLVLPEYRVLFLAKAFAEEGAHSPSEHVPSLLRVIADLIQSFPEAELSDRNTSGFLLSFSRPSDAVRFAVLLQHRITNGSTPTTLVRCAIHAGEILVQRNVRGGKALVLEGESVELVRLLVEVARPRQILVSRSVFDSARTVIRGRDLFIDCKVSWLDHGAYIFQGFEDPIGVCEVGETARAPLSAPLDSVHVRRHPYSSHAAVLGWRPAVDQEIPTSPGWVLTEKLGEGGFGEVWRARGKDGVETRVFKFCFQTDRVRSLKREVTLLHMLREAVGDHQQIVHIFSVYLESPPYYIEMEDVPGRDLAHWCETHGGVEAIPLQVRLDIVAQTAEALQAAHDAGIIHRDVKPSNILVVGKPHAPRTIVVKLGDFGIGQTVKKNSISATPLGGFTETFTPTEMASQSGTRLYMAPELMSGRPASIRSDIYSLGVVLYQLLTGDLHRMPATDWQKDVKDTLLQADVGKCLAGSPTARFVGAADLAESLRSLGARRTNLESRLRQEKRARFRRRTLLAGAAVLGLLLVFVGALAYGLVEANRARRVAETEKEKAQTEEYFSKVALAQRAIERNRLGSAYRFLLDCPLHLRGWEWGRLLLLCNNDMMAYRGLAGYAKCLALSPDGKRIAAGADDGRVMIWDLETGVEGASLDPLPTRVDSLAFSPDSGLLAAQSGNLIQIYDSSTGSRIRDLRLPHTSNAGVAFNPVTGRLAYDQTQTCTLVLFDLQAGQVEREFKGHYQWITDFAFSKDGKKVISTAYDNTVRLWDVVSGNEIALHKTPYAPKSVALGSSGSIALVAIDKTGAVILEVEKGLAQGWDSRVPEGAASVDISPNEEFLLVVQLNNVTRVWDWKRSAPPVSLDREYGPALFDITGDTILTAEPGGPIKRWGFQLGDGGTPIYGHNLGYLCHAIAFSSDGTRVATGSDDQTASIWDVDSGDEVAMLQHYSEVSSLLFTQDGRNLITGCSDGTVWVWDSNTKQRTGRIQAHTDEISSMAVTRDSAFLLTGSFDGMIRVWDYRTGNKKKQLLPDCGKVRSISLSPDGTRILAAGELGDAVIMSLESGQVTSVLKGHTSIVRDCEWSPDGSWVATAGEDGTCRKWDPGTGLQTAIYRGTSGDLTAVEVTPDGRRVLTSGKILDSLTFREIIGINDIWAPITLSADGLMLGANVFETPAIIRSFPWTYESLPAKSQNDLEIQIEQFKRDFWKKRKARKLRWAFDDRFRSLPNTVTGQWDFDGGDLRATVGKDMLYYDYEERGDIQSRTRFGTTSSLGIPRISGKEANVMFFPACGPKEGFRMLHGALVNETGKKINQYSVILDLLFPSSSSGTWRSILNTDGNNLNPGDLFISDSNGLGVDDDFAGTVSPDQWHRIACVFDLSATPPTLRKYLDGVPIEAQKLPAGENGRWSIPPADRGRWILLFADPEGRTNSGYVNSIQFRNYAMTDEEVAVLGGPSADGTPLTAPVVVESHPSSR